MVEGQCDGIDINFGCPQKVAERGKYGAFLMDDWDKLVSIVWTLSHGGLSVPVTLKVQTCTPRRIRGLNATAKHNCCLIVSPRLHCSILYQSMHSVLDRQSAHPDESVRECARDGCGLPDAGSGASHTANFWPCTENNCGEAFKLI